MDPGNPCSPVMICPGERSFFPDDGRYRQSDGLKPPGADKGSGISLFRRVLVAPDIPAHGDTTPGCTAGIPGTEEIPQGCVLIIHLLR
jgi:hypothetical protein